MHKKENLEGHTRRLLCLVLTAFVIHSPSIHAKDAASTIDETYSTLNSINTTPPAQSCGDLAAQVPKQMCDTLTPRPDSFYFLPQKWQFDAFGLDLFRKDSVVLQAKPQGTLAFVDTGESVRKNPAAGDTLRKQSPEVEYDDHGTHVIGSAASEEYGVNPRLSTHMFPAINHGGLFDTADLFNQMDAAVSDKSVSTVSISISFREDPANESIIRKAIDQNKWIVYAAGNEGEVNDSSAAGQAAFDHSPNFFSIGSLNYFGAPSFFSNFGSRTQFFSPGSQITSLNAGFDPNLKDTKSSLDMSGTSMATPIFAAVLQTLRDIDPKLSATQAKKILTLSAIPRGSNPIVAQINPLLAADLLGQAKSCLHIAGANEDSCLNGALKKIQAAIAVPIEPTTENCADLKTYYDSLRRDFFLSKGSPEISQKIIAFLNREKLPAAWAGRVYFSPSGQELSAFSAIPHSDLHTWARREYAHSNDFYNGKYALQDNVGKAGSASILTGIYLLPAIPENLEQYWSQCQDKLYTSDSDDCRHYLFSAPLNFRSLIAKRLADANRSILDADVLSSLNFNSDLDPKIYEKLLKAAVSGYFAHPSFEKINVAENVLFPNVSVDVRERMVRDFFARIENHTIDTSGFPKPPFMGRLGKTLDDVTREMQFWAPPDLLAKVGPTLKDTFIKECNASRGISDTQDTSCEVSYLVFRAQAGYEVDELIKKIEANAPHKDTLADFDSFFDDFNNPVFMQSFLNLLRKPDGIFELCKFAFHQLPGFPVCHFDSRIMSAPFLSQVLIAVNKSDPALAKKVFDSLMDQSKTGQINIDALESMKEIPFVGADLNSVKAEPQTRPVFKELRQNYLYTTGLKADPSSPIFKAAQAELPTNYRNSYEVLSLDRTMQSPAAKAAFLSDLSNFKIDREDYTCSSASEPQVSSYIANLASSYKGEASKNVGELKILFPKLKDHLLDIVKSLDSPIRMGANSTLYPLGIGLARAVGDDPSAVHFIMDTAYKAFSEPLLPCYGEGPISVLFELARTKLGADYLKSHPKWVQAIASDISLKNSAILAPFPPEIGLVLKEKLPNASTLVSGIDNDSYARLPGWIGTLISTNTDMFSYALELAKAAKSSGKINLLDNIMSAVSDQFQANPDFGRAHLEELRSFTFYSGGNVPTNFADAIGVRVQ